VHRFHVPPSDWHAGTVSLPETEAAHAARVLRVRDGEQVEIFDGTGRAAAAVVVEVGKRSVVVEVRREWLAHRPLPGIHLVVALIKGDRFDWMIQKATELGAASIRPVAAARSVVRIEGAEAERRLTKWRQVSVEAAKQCGHLVLPEIHALMPPAAAFRSAPDGRRGIPALHPGGRALGAFLAEGEGETTFAIGSEGDWTPEEMEDAQACGFVPLDLGRHVLRSETAAAHVLSVAAHQLHGGPGGLGEGA
jgi:16S rRNA (uracil1498-N3)-methyltransferase